ncbi:MAG: HlyD family efflux transporter periplasmic adaptor subunit [Heteroscytonema crispum UTEX LB 1556]
MKLPFASSPAQARQTKEQFANPDAYLDYELGKAVQELPPLYTRLVGITLSLAVFGAIAWAGLSKVDDVAQAHGKLIPGEEVQPVRSPSGGKIKYINPTKVKEGQQVQQGETLIALDSESSQVDIERLNNQLQLINQEYQYINATDKGQKARIAQEKFERDRLLNAFAEAKNEQDRLCPLVGGIPYLTCERAKHKVKDLKSSIQKQDEKIKQIEADYQTEIINKQNQLRQQWQEKKRQLEQAQKQQQNQIITSPITGRVYNIKVNQSQGIVQSGEELLSILPEGKEPLLEVDLPNQYKAFVHEKMKAKVKIDSLNYQEFGIIDGEVINISPNAVIKDKASGKAVYPTRIKLDSVMLKKRGLDKQLTAGMTAEGDIVMRQKSVLSLLLEPIARKFDDVFSRK